MVEMVNLEYACFPPFIQQTAMGIYDPETDIPRIRQKYIDEMLEDPADIWIKVVEKASGKIVAGSNWKVYLNGPPEDRPMDTAPSWLEGEARERSETFVEKANETRLSWMKGVSFICM